jgi:hypothetical protein
MSRSFLVSKMFAAGALVVGSIVLLSPAPAAGQTPNAAAKPAPAEKTTPPAKTGTLPRTPDGHPDLNGVWNNGSLTPFERPDQLTSKQQFTPEEAAAFEKARLNQVNHDRRSGDKLEDLDGAYNEVWFDRGTKVSRTKRTSLIVDPPDGRVPPMTPDAQANYERIEAKLAQHGADSAEDRPLPERCLMFSQVGPPMLPGNYNDNYQIVQSSKAVTILAEMGDIARVIPLDGRPHLPANMRQWTGDPRGHWEGDTLVVDSTNFRFTDRSRFGVVYDGMTDGNLHVIERFTRTDPGTLLYKATVDDPSVYTKPWTVEVAMTKTKDHVFEYACHEGNYAMVGILSGARADEKKK